MVQIAGVAVFILIMTAVYGLFLLYLLHRMLKAMSRRPVPKSVFDNKYFAATLMTVSLAGIICIIWGTFAEPYIITVTDVHISTDKFEHTVAPLRIVQISDLHFSEPNRLTRSLPNRIGALEPDVIVLTGDYLNSPRAADLLEEFLTSLEAPFGVYYVNGNYEKSYPSEKVFAQCGLSNLEYRSRRMELRGAELELIGAPLNVDGDRLKKVIPDDADCYKIVLSHYPSDFPTILESDVDLCLSGHTHGGQVRLPLYGALVTLSPTGKRYECGLYEENGTKLFVSRGIGMMGGRLVPKVRFNCPPEIVLIQIEGQE
jgi:predicted MPP superfamily phosphohydrolase